MENSKIIDFNNLSKQLSNKSFVVICVYLMLLSYFYNLPVLNYSLTGNNELRLFDLTGILLLYVVYSNNTLLMSVITNTTFFKNLFYFLIWASFTLIFTFLYSLAVGNLVWGIQSTLYMFHFWSFFITAVFAFILIQDLSFLKKIVTFTLIIANITFFVVILQNFTIVPFLWGEVYRASYNNFLSGTLGPNKIVLGMTCLFLLIFSIGLFNEKRVKLNSILLITTISISLITLILSGSRTTYVGLLIFALYYFIRDFYKFIVSVIVLTIVFVIVSSINNEIFSKLTDVYEYRVENKIKNKQNLNNARVDKLYEDLGSGRKELSMLYVNFLAENVYIIPFGSGFNNRLIIGESSAHNIYLSLINETGLVGLFLYLRWFLSLLKLKLLQFKQLEVAFHGLILAMLVTLLFGEHIYVYRTSFGLTGLFLFLTVIFASPLHHVRELQAK